MATGKDDIVFIYTTFADVEQAKTLGAKLIFEKLAACVNIFPNMISLYEWDGEMQSETEAAMFIKTRRAVLDSAMNRTRELHPYETPALLALPIEHADKNYAKWIQLATGGGT